MLKTSFVDQIVAQTIYIDIHWIQKIMNTNVFPNISEGHELNIYWNWNALMTYFMKTLSPNLENDLRYLSKMCIILCSKS